MYVIQSREQFLLLLDGEILLVVSEVWFYVVVVDFSSIFIVTVSLVL